MKKPPRPEQASETKSKHYRIEFSTKAGQQFQKLPLDAARQMKPAIMALADDPRPLGYKKLAGRPGFRIRVGDYRAIYLIDDTILLVEILEVGHRREVYE